MRAPEVKLGLAVTPEHASEPLHILDGLEHAAPLWGLYIRMLSRADVVANNIPPERPLKRSACNMHMNSRRAEEGSNNSNYGGPSALINLLPHRPELDKARQLGVNHHSPICRSCLHRPYTPLLVVCAIILCRGCIPLAHDKVLGREGPSSLTSEKGAHVICAPLRARNVCNGMHPCTVGTRHPC